MITPGPWQWWTSNSWKRLRHDSAGHTVDVLTPVRARDGQPDLIVSAADMRAIEAVPELIEALRASWAIGHKTYHNANAHEAYSDWSKVRKLLQKAFDKAGVDPSDVILSPPKPAPSYRDDPLNPIDVEGAP